MNRGFPRVRCLGLAAALCFLISTPAQQPPGTVQRRATPKYTKVPEVTNLRLEQATALIESRLLRWRVAGSEPSNAPRGTVLNQNLPAGKPVPVNTEVVLIVSQGPPTRPISVPDFAGRHVEEPRKWAASRRAGFEVREAQSDAPEGYVIRQDPRAGTPVDSRQSLVITVWVSSGPGLVPVPEVRKLHLKQAMAELRERTLAGVVVGEECSSLPPGIVLVQNPQPQEPVRRGHKVELVISAAGSFPASAPGVVGSYLEVAAGQLTQSNMKVQVKREPSNQPSGLVISQDPPAGAPLDPCRPPVMTLVVSAGIPLVEVPEVRKRLLKDALAVLGKNSLNGLEAGNQCAPVPPGTILDQDPRPPQKISAGSKVKLVVSTAPPHPDTTPAITGSPWDTIAARLAQLNVNTQVRREPSNQPPGVVIGQDPPAGSPRDPCQPLVIIAVVSTGPGLVDVPEVRERPVKAALTALQRASLNGVEAGIQCAPMPPGTVLEQDPSPPRKVSPGSNVKLVVSTAPPYPDTTPALTGLHWDAAAARLNQMKAKFQVRKETSSQSPDVVVGQDPPAGSPRDPCQPLVITAVVSTGPGLVDVPEVRKRPVKAALMMLQRASLNGIEAGNQCAPLPPGTVLEQEPSPRQKVSAGSNVKLVVSTAPPFPDTTPAVTGLLWDAVAARLNQLNVKTQVRREPGNQPAGIVIGQDPPAGAPRDPCQPPVMTVVISAGPVLVPVPEVTRRPLPEAMRILSDASLRGTVVREAPSGQPAGSVLSQRPQPPARVERGTPVELVVSAGDNSRFLVEVPNVVGMLVPPAEDLLAQRRLGLRIEAEQEHGAPEGSIISQQPRAGSTVDLRERNTVSVVVSQGLVEVPEVTGRNVRDAMRLLESRSLRGREGSRLASDSPAGVVLRQSRQPGERVPRGTEVEMEVSAGPQRVRVPSVIGLSQEDAWARLRQALLELEVAGEQESEKPPGTVLSQSPAAGEYVEPGDPKVSVTLSRGLDLANVPDLRGLLLGAAFSYLSRDRLRLGAVTQESSEQAAGVVLNQSPAPGARVRPDTEVALTVSAGTSAPGPDQPPLPPTEVEVPSLVGQTLEAAQAELSSRNLVFGRVSTRAAPPAPGSIVEQNPAAGTRVPSGTPVQLVLSTGPVLVLVPNVVGLTLEAARNQLAAVGLAAAASPAEFVADEEARVAEQDPQPLSRVATNATVQLTLASGGGASIPFAWMAGGLGLLGLAGTVGYRVFRRVRNARQDRAGESGLPEFVPRPDAGAQVLSFLDEAAPGVELRIRCFLDEGEQTVVAVGEQL